VRVACGRCLSYGEGISYFPIVEARPPLPWCRFEVAVDEARATPDGDPPSPLDWLTWLERKDVLPVQADIFLSEFFPNQSTNEIQIYANHRKRLEKPFDEKPRPT
jgi:hypothetical protein